MESLAGAKIQTDDFNDPVDLDLASYPSLQLSWTLLDGPLVSRQYTGELLAVAGKE